MPLNMCLINKREAISYEAYLCSPSRAKAKRYNEVDDSFSFTRRAIVLYATVSLQLFEATSSIFKVAPRVDIQYNRLLDTYLMAFGTKPLGTTEVAVQKCT